MNKIITITLGILVLLAGFNTYMVLQPKGSVLGGSTASDWNVGGNLTVTGNDSNGIAGRGTNTLAGSTNITGTSTLTVSYDGFVVQPTMSYATGTPVVYTNTTGKAMMCRAGGVYADSLSASLGRNFKVSMGTSTGIVGAGTNLLSTTTVATTTDTFLGLTYTAPFSLANNESIITYFADVDANASSTYFTSTYWRVQPAISCTLLGG